MRYFHVLNNRDVLQWSRDPTFNNVLIDMVVHDAKPHSICMGERRHNLEEIYIEGISKSPLFSRFFRQNQDLAEQLSDVIAEMRGMIETFRQGYEESGECEGTLSDRTISWSRDFRDNHKELIIACINCLAQPGITILVFVDGVHGIMELEEELSALPDAEANFCVMKLHSMVPKEEESETMKKIPDKCKVILSTVVGESSITFPDTSYVIDTGEVK